MNLENYESSTRIEQNTFDGIQINPQQLSQNFRLLLNEIPENEGEKINKKQNINFKIAEYFHTRWERRSQKNFSLNP